MSAESNIQIVRRGYEAFGRGDIEALLGLFHENIEWTSPGPPDLPTAGTRRGLQEVASFFTAVNEVFETQRFEPISFIGQGDQVVVLGEETSRIRATGELMSGAWAHAFTLRDGKVLRFTEYVDTSAVVEALRRAHAGA